MHFPHRHACRFVPMLTSCGGFLFLFFSGLKLVPPFAALDRLDHRIAGQDHRALRSPRSCSARPAAPRTLRDVYNRGRNRALVSSSMAPNPRSSRGRARALTDGATRMRPKVLIPEADVCRQRPSLVCPLPTRGAPCLLMPSRCALVVGARSGAGSDRRRCGVGASTRRRVPRGRGRAAQASCANVGGLGAGHGTGRRVGRRVGL